MNTQASAHEQNKSLVDRLNAEAEKERAADEKRWNGQSPLERLADFPRVMPLAFTACGAEEYTVTDSAVSLLVWQGRAAELMRDYLDGIMAHCGLTRGSAWQEATEKGGKVKISCALS